MALKASALKVGDTHSEQVVENLSRTQIVQYAGVSGDYNPLHTDEVYTVQVAGYPSVFAHGMLTMGLTGKMLTNYVGDGRLTKFGVRFTNQVWPGDTLESKATVAAIREENGQKVADLTISTTNQDGKEVVFRNCYGASGSVMARPFPTAGDGLAFQACRRVSPDVRNTRLIQRVSLQSVSRVDCQVTICHSLPRLA